MKVLLIKYGEIALRGKNRYLYENQLIRLIAHKLRVFGGVGEFRVTKEQGRILVSPYHDEGVINIEAAKDAVSTIFGINAICPAVILSDQSIENIKREALEYVREHCLQQMLTFKVETSRADKRYPLSSHQVSADVGGHILENTGYRVDVHNPQVTISIELRSNCYIYSNVVPGLGGLPVGSSGRAVLLLSGGIDSPVSGFQMMKRGVSLDCVYFHSPPYTSERAKQKVVDLAQRLAEYHCGTEMALHVIPFTEIQNHIHDNVAESKMTLLLKRAMLHIADKLAEQTQAEALILGDSVGQVASQTLRSMSAIESAAKLPILRPLCGYNKQEIVNLAKNIGTYEISIRPYEDCCTIFVAKHPETKPKVSIIEKIDMLLMEELAPMIESALSSAERRVL